MENNIFSSTIGTTWTRNFFGASLALSIAACGGGAPSTSEANPPALAATIVSVPAQTPTGPWTKCANEYGVCNFPGTMVIRYGLNGIYAYRTATTSIACGNQVFGDPYPGANKICEYAAPVSTPPAATPPAATPRDALKQPFASTSIWNMPIGSAAVYVAANLPAKPNNDTWSPMPSIDDERIVLKPTAPLAIINGSSAAWSGANRCSATGGELVRVPMPSSYVIPNSGANEGASFLLADGRTIVQLQPVARCSAGSSGTALVKFPNVDLYGAGITGAHGGSGMSAIGGSLRLGELRPSSQAPRHALKLNVYAKQALYKCTTRAACSRWPATTSDGYAVGFYGTNGNNSNTAMKMGALLAIRGSVDINTLGLETAPAKQLAWTLQNYGAYIVDDTYGPGLEISAENGPDGSMRAQFQSDWGYPMAGRVNDNTPWTRDMQKLVTALYVVNNNSATSIGGGGTPRQPLAAALPY